jgi:hypothetical protein
LHSSAVPDLLAFVPRPDPARKGCWLLPINRTPTLPPIATVDHTSHHVERIACNRFRRCPWIFNLAAPEINTTVQPHLHQSFEIASILPPISPHTAHPIASKQLLAMHTT